MKKILFIGQFFDACGYGSAARKYIEAFDDCNISDDFELTIAGLNFENVVKLKPRLEKYLTADIEDYSRKNKGQYICIVHLLPNIIEQMGGAYKTALENSAKNYNLVAWETTKIPNLWKEIYSSSRYSEIIVPSSWNKRVFELEQTLPVRLLPHPVQIVPMAGPKEKEFNILSISQWSPRKGFDLLIQAFCSEFFYDDKATLTIKSYVGNPADGAVANSQHLINEIKTLKNKIFDYENTPKCKIKVFPGYISEEELDRLYRLATVFCLPSRGEGFSLPIYEAAARGIPVIAPNLGGHTDFLDDTFLCESKFQTVTGLNTFYSSLEMKGVETDFESLRSKMRMAYDFWKNDSTSLEEVGKNNQMLVGNNLSSEVIYRQFRKIIDE